MKKAKRVPLYVSRTIRDALKVKAVAENLKLFEMAEKIILRGLKNGKER